MPNKTGNRGTKKRNGEHRKAKQNKGKSPIRKESATSLNGAPAGTRTPDTLLKRQVLYLLSYWGRLAGMAGLEPTISESKSGVLPLHYIPIWRRLVNEPGQAGLILCGVGYGARTHDTRNHNPVLYQLS